MLVGIDVSDHQGVFPWERVTPNIQFAILRSSHGMSEIDEQWERNYEECKRLGIPIGCYHYFYYADRAKHEKELANFLNAIRGKTFELPVFVDYEEEGGPDRILGGNIQPLGALDPEAITDYLLYDLAMIRKAGFKAGVYANRAWLERKMQDERIPAEDWVWLAEWGVSLPKYKGRWNVWQITSQGKIKGYDGRLDVNRLDGAIPGPSNMPTLRIGSSGSFVMDMKNKLNRKGGYGLPVTPDFDKLTQAVVYHFQTVNNLIVDGVVGKQTWKNLMK